MTGMWPSNARCAVMLGFDVDGRWLWLSLNRDSAKFPSLMSMGDYGIRVAMPRILRLLDEYRVKATFFVPGRLAEEEPDMVRHIARQGHEVGHHGYLHESVVGLERKAEFDILEKGIEVIKSLTGSRPTGYRAPFWELTENSLDLLLETGFSYDSSLMGDDAPYVLDRPGGRIVEVPPHWSLDDYPYLAYAPRARVQQPITSPRVVFDAWSGEFDGAYRYRGALLLTMHPQIIGRPGRILMLEELLRHIRAHADAVFMTGAEMAQHFLKQPRSQGA